MSWPLSLHRGRRQVTPFPVIFALAIGHRGSSSYGQYGQLPRVAFVDGRHERPQ